MGKNRFAIWSSRIWSNSRFNDNGKSQATNGISPLGVVACKEEIYDAVMDGAPKGTIELFHGYTYSGIPDFSSMALAVQDIFEKDDIFNRAKELAPYFQEGLFSLKDIDVVDNIRGYGMMGGIDIKTVVGRPGKAGLATLNIVMMQELISKLC